MRKLFFLFLVMISGSFFFAHLFNYISTSNAQKPSHHFKSISPTIVSMQVLGASTTQQNIQKTHSEELEKIVNNALRGTKGTYAVVINNFATNESYKKADSTRFETASLYKLWVMGEVFRQIEGGKLTKTTSLSQDVAVLNTKFRIASESAEKTDGKIELTVEEALNRMITYSDNYSALLLAEKVRLSAISSFLSQNGLNESKVGTGSSNPSSTAGDIAAFFEKLHKGEIVSHQASQEMLTLLKKQQLNGKLPKYLPKAVPIAHKTGELDPFSHDAGIVYAKKGEYLIVILTETNSRQQADERIAGISQGVYEYFNRE